MLDNGNRIKQVSYLLKLCVGCFLLLLLLQSIKPLFIADYGQYFGYIIKRLYVPSAKDLPVYKNIFIGLRIFSVAVLLWWLYRFIRFIMSKQILLVKREDIFFDAITNSILNNLAYIRSIGKHNRIILCTLLIIQFTSFLYFILTLPYHTDEAYSYIYFSSKGLLSTITFYPQPNNHVFYNIVAGFMLVLPIDPITALRLPNLLIGLISTFYFFKLAHKLLPIKLSLVATTLFTFSFPFVFYSFQARGYAFVLFFALIVFYAFVNMAEGKDLKKYLALYVVCTVLGFYTIPTFLYFIVPVGILLFILFIIKRYPIGSFIKAHVYILVFTVLLYLPIIARNGLGALVSSKGVATIKSLGYVKENIGIHLSDTWGFINNANIPIIAIIPIIALLCMLLYKNTSYKRYTILLMMFMLVSPVPIIFLHKVIPFSRTWIFLIIPLALGIGMILELLLKVIKPDKIREFSRSVFVWVFVICWSSVMVVKAKQGHKAMLGIDFIVRDYVTAIEDRLGKVESIQRTDDFSFYLAEDIQSELVKRKRDIQIGTVQPTDSMTADLVVTGTTSQLTIPANYQLIPIDNTYFRLYIKKDL